MFIIRKIENGRYEFVERFTDKDGDLVEHTLSWIYPCSTNKRRYDAETKDGRKRFPSIKYWKNWCAVAYGAKEV